jgi:hypothetical protein
MSARQEPSYPCTISRHGIAKPSLTLLIWLIEMAASNSDVGRSLRPAATIDISTNNNANDKSTQTLGTSV